MDGQATAPEVLDVNGLADLLTDEPLEESEIEEETLTESDDDSNDQPDESEDDSESEEEDPDKPTTDLTFKVKVLGEDGEPVEKEVPAKELIDGYMMRSDYTRKTQELANKEREVTQHLAAKYEENRNHYLHEAQLARAVVAQFAGIKSHQEMAELANTDPGAWVAENQRQQTVSSLIGSLEQRIQAEQSQISQQTEQRTRAMYENAWQELSKDGIDRNKLAEIYQKSCEKYGFTMEDFNSVYDPRAVRVFKDNVEMRERLAQLEQKAKTVSKQVSSATKVPNKQAPAANERKDRSLEAKFRSGTARLNDLAAWLS